MNPLLDHLVDNWKSTVANFLTVVIVGLGYLLTLPADTLAANGLSTKEIFWMGVVSAIAKLYVGLITKDAK